MDVRELIGVLRARWLAIVAATVLGGLLALGASLLTTPTYESRIQFYTTTATSGESAAAAYQGSLGAQQRVQSYAELVQSREIAQQVIDEVGARLTADEVVESTSASADSSTVLLDVAVTDTDPARAFTIAGGFGRVLPEAIRALETPDGGGPALATLTVVDPPVLPAAPVAPRTAQNVAVGLGLGALLGVGLALLVNALDRRVKTSDQVEDLSGAPVVGSIPFRKTEDKEPNSAHVVPFREGHSPAAEAFRRLRTNLEFLNVDTPPRVFVVTSSVAMEGKSESALNLSLALAESGHRVLLVEADLRRPKVAKYLSMPDAIGLTSILSGQAELCDVVQETRHPGLSLLASGPLPPNPSELLASDAARRFIDTIRQHFDFVIFDSPPLLPVTDGALLARITDGALVVVRMHRTTSDQLVNAVDNLAKADARVLGMIAVANKRSKNGAGDYYGGYYYSTKTPALQSSLG